jgi:3-deoxy-D-manno-octulosonic-acid transferase
MLFPELQIYRGFTAIFPWIMRIMATFNPKAKKWLDGRKQLPMFNHDQPCIWMHCSSLGEFEQGRPVFEALRENYPNHYFVLSFFSPSGYEIRKNYPGADQVIYLPLDTTSNAIKLIQEMKPQLVIWVKYEYWFNILQALHKKGIPVLLISAKFRSKQAFFSWYGRFWKTQLGFFDRLFVQDHQSLDLLNSIGIGSKVSITGDTRFDRVLKLKSAYREPDKLSLSDFIQSSKVLVAGSVWEDDLILIQNFKKKVSDFKYILVPHEVNKASLQRCLEFFTDAIFLSDWIVQNETTTHSNVLIVDQVGLLSTLYNIATITYVGGGFNKSGIHNTLEPAVWGKPVFFGPNFQKFGEAIKLIECGGGFSVRNTEEWITQLEKNKLALEQVGTHSQKFVQANAGATKKILDYIAENLLLTK